jgi:hypothetical protein
LPNAAAKSLVEVEFVGKSFLVVVDAVDEADSEIILEDIVEMMMNEVYSDQLDMSSGGLCSIAILFGSTGVIPCRFYRFFGHPQIYTTEK